MDSVSSEFKTNRTFMSEGDDDVVIKMLSMVICLKGNRLHYEGDGRHDICKLCRRPEE